MAEDPKSGDIIRPVIRGRDIKRYSYEFANLYLITTFPSRKYNIDDYPAVKTHLLSFGYERLKQTGDAGSRKKTHNKWFETQDSISYWEDFSKQKIVWGEISDRTKFAFDLTGKFVPEATTFLMVGNSLLYLVAILNSRLSEYVFSKIGTTTGVGTVRWKKYTVEQLPIPDLSFDRQQEYEKVVLQLINCINDKKDYGRLESKIDEMIYFDLNFNKEEINFIESQHENL